MLFTQHKEELSLAQLGDQEHVIDWLTKRNPNMSREALSRSIFDSLTASYTKASQDGIKCYTKGDLPWFFIREGQQVLLVSTLIIPVMLYELVENT